MCLDKGRLNEFGTPSDLSKADDGIFKSMLKDAGIRDVPCNTYVTRL